MRRYQFERILDTLTIRRRTWMNRRPCRASRYFGNCQYVGRVAFVTIGSKLWRTFVRRAIVNSYSAFCISRLLGTWVAFTAFRSR